jgi:hypothetical protein
MCEVRVTKRLQASHALTQRGLEGRGGTQRRVEPEHLQDVVADPLTEVKPLAEAVLEYDAVGLRGDLGGHGHSSG